MENERDGGESKRIKEPSHRTSLEAGEERDRNEDNTTQGRSSQEIYEHA